MDIGYHYLYSIIETLIPNVYIHDQNIYSHDPFPPNLWMNNTNDSPGDVQNGDDNSDS